MPKLILAPIANGENIVNSYNNNNALIEAAIENTLSRDGSVPNELDADIDMNSRDINNAGIVRTTQLFINGSEASVGLGGGGTTDPIIVKQTDETRLLDSTQVLDAEVFAVLDPNSFYQVDIDLILVTPFSGGIASFQFDGADGTWQSEVQTFVGNSTTLTTFARSDIDNTLFFFNVRDSEISRLTARCSVQTAGAGGVFGIIWGQLFPFSSLTMIRGSWIRALKLL